MTKNDLYYLRSILRYLQEAKRRWSAQYGLADEVLADNIDWLDCFIEKHERHKQRTQRR